jgi:hypothetical protein
MGYILVSFAAGIAAGEKQQRNAKDKPHLLTPQSLPTSRKGSARSLAPSPLFWGRRTVSDRTADPLATSPLLDKTNVSDLVPRVRRSGGGRLMPQQWNLARRADSVVRNHRVRANSHPHASAQGAPILVPSTCPRYATTSAETQHPSPHCVGTHTKMTDTGPLPTATILCAAAAD